ncbi:pathogenic type III effector avirulence factor Avr AvrRpt-cleavage: cleavage site protein [Senna tora]|uniref:Pathogenic type III effector avirulence factor Avr AvrRpt-cleavage: cleavage site protein n=1 Tax=Senna tora TaxID=362788 RepID=A0A834XJ11_9FABA|nr:pathogenic type III effector avirulence factor Avr AvrRpt-cleavage: cleavage site protein [Senna tora]
MLVTLQAKGRKQHEKEAKKQSWVSNVKEPSSPKTTPIAPTLPRPTPKPVDEDLRGVGVSFPAACCHLAVSESLAEISKAIVQ